MRKSPHASAACCGVMRRRRFFREIYGQRCLASACACEASCRSSAVLPTERRGAGAQVSPLSIIASRPLGLPLASPWPPLGVPAGVLELGNAALLAASVSVSMALSPLVDKRGGASLNAERPRRRWRGGRAPVGLTPGRARAPRREAFERPQDQKAVALRLQRGGYTARGILGWIDLHVVEEAGSRSGRRMRDEDRCGPKPEARERSRGGRPEGRTGKVGGLAQILQRGAPARRDRVQVPGHPHENRRPIRPAVGMNPGNSSSGWSSVRARINVGRTLPQAGGDRGVHSILAKTVASQTEAASGRQRDGRWISLTRRSFSAPSSP